jgi:cysteine protease ATG4
MVVHVVSGDADGERGGAPVLCVEDVTHLCSKWGEHAKEWPALLVLVPLVLGLDKVNPRYMPSLSATFTFPQSLGIMGGKPGASTYLVGVQDGQALYLDPHETQQAVRILPENPEVDTSSYHCSIVRRIPLDSIDPSLALGFYCRNREEFDDLCARSSELAEQSNGAPMFTVAQNSAPIKPADTSDRALALQESHPKEPSSEDDWQIL